MVTNVRLVRVLWVALIALLVVASAAPIESVRAQGPTSTPDPELELVGVITAVAPGSFIVNGVTVFTANAELKVQPQVGIAVKVHGRLQPDQSIVAREVEAIAANDLGVRPGEAEFLGVMTSFIGATMVVNGMTVDVSAAEIHGRLDPGGLVWVHATWDVARNVWVAREVGPFAPTRDVSDDLARFDDDEFEIIGTLTALTPESVTVAGLVIDIRGAEVKDTLTLGSLVKVELHVVDGQLVAIELDRTSQDRLRDSLMTRGRSGRDGFDDNGNDNENDGNFNDNNGGDDDGNNNDNADDHGNDNRGGDDNGNDNGGDD